MCKILDFINFIVSSQLLDDCYWGLQKESVEPISFICKKVVVEPM